MTEVYLNFAFCERNERMISLDGIGPAFFATMEQLKNALVIIEEAVK